MSDTCHTFRRAFRRGLGALALGAALAGSLRAEAASPPQPVNSGVNVGQTTIIQNPGVVSWVHFGDLHIQTGDLHIQTGDMQNYADFQTIIKNTNQYLLNGVNFAVLPGDNANEGSEAEYQLIKQATDQLRVPLYAIPGDHDLKGGSLSLYRKYLEPVAYQSFTADRYHFVFLDALDAGESGGFGLGATQTAWLTADLDAAAAKGLQSILFMHPFPSGLQDSASGVQSLLQKDHVLLVETGHTHFNEIANDGRTIYAATRSTGQASEGPVGFSLTNLDNGVVSWKFKPLGTWPFVMITSPSDKQLITDTRQPNQVVRGIVNIRAKVWDDKGVASATFQVDNGAAQPLARIGTSQMWSAAFDSAKVTEGDHQITVTARGAGGNVAEDKIAILVSQSGTYQPPLRAPGADNNSIGIYAEKGLLGTQRGGGGRGHGGPGGRGGKGGRRRDNPAPNNPAPNSPAAPLPNTAPLPG